MSVSDSDKDSVTEVAEESFVRERPLEIARGAVLAGRYQVEEIIGKGGSGVVLRVFDRTVQTVVALKVLKTELARDAKWDKRFSRELRLGRPIQHANVCRIFDIGEADGHRFLTMELATGGSLRDELKRRPALERPLEERLRDAKAAIEGLAAIHGAGVVHRDFKPDNLLRMEDGRLVISDFGLATDAATAPGVTVMIGTPHYMAPEVLAGEPATTRSDVWALGVVLHEICFGRRPERKSVSFDGTDRGPIRPATSVERAVLELCERCLADVSSERPADATEVSRLFFEWMRRAGQRKNSKRTWASWPAVILAAVLVAGGGWAIRTRRKDHQRTAAPALIESRNGPIGDARDLSPIANTAAAFSGAVHCLRPIDDHTVRVIWGAPRRADEVDLATGRVVPSKLIPETFRASCPDYSRSTNQLLYAARNEAGAMEVRLSFEPDGGHANVVTPGRDPRWLPGQNAFMFSVDDAHVAVFSLATMEFRLLGTGADARRFEISGQAVSETSARLAVTGFDDRAEAWVEIFPAQDESRKARFVVPLGSRIAFAWRDDEILISGPVVPPEGSIALLNIESGTYRRFGRIPGRDITHVAVAGDRLAFVARQFHRDVWSYDGESRTRLTTEDDVMGAAISPSGDLLLARQAYDGALNIWLRHKDGEQRRLTSGPKDVTPAFSRDGRLWAYADYSNGAIWVCRTGGACRTLMTDKSLPGFPTFSPSAERLSVLTQIGRPQMKIIGTDGEVLAAWDALPVCGGMWSSDEKVWNVENVRGSYFWAEHDALSGRSTGARVPLANDEGNDSPLMDCRARRAGAGSPLFRQVQVENSEQSQVRVVDRKSLGL